MKTYLLLAAVAAALPCAAAPVVSGPGACGARAVDNAAFVSCEGDELAVAMPAARQAAAPVARTITARDAWRLRHDRGARALLVDIRGIGEVIHHGMPLGSDANVPYLRTLSAFPDPGTIRSAGAPFNPNFLRHVDAARIAAGLRYQDPLVLLCRTGALSRYAAELLIEYGYTDVRIVSGGFDGAGGADGPGWKRAGLPWSREVQDGWVRLGG
jgi:rhodanese-related sulfurtransferase